MRKMKNVKNEKNEKFNITDSCFKNKLNIQDIQEIELIIVNNSNLQDLIVCERSNEEKISALELKIKNQNNEHF